jgi:hypothetical protein
MQERVPFRCDEVLLLAVPRVQNAGAWRASLLPKEGFWLGEVSIVVEAETDSSSSSSDEQGDNKEQREKCYVKFHNADGSLFALSDVSMPGAVEFTVDSSRYCIVTVLNKATGQKKLVALMFTKAQATSAFNFKLTVKDWKKGGGGEPDEESAEVQALHTPLEDLSLAPGQMIVVKNVGKKKDKAEGKGLESSASSFVVSSSSSSSSSSAPIALAPPPKKDKKDKKDKKKKHKKKDKKQEEDPFASPSGPDADPFGGSGEATAFGGDWSGFD